MGAIPITWLAALAAISTFGPYFTVGIRTEQLVVFALGVIGVARHLTSGRRADPTITALILLWSAILIMSTIAGLFPPAQVADAPMLGGIEALALPLAVMILVAVWTAEVSARDILLTVQKWTVGLLSLNGLIALAMTQFRDPLWPFLNRFFWSGAEGGSTGMNAALMGRFGGVFNSPMSAGTAYSVALCAALYLYTQRAWPRWFLVPSLGLIVVGGFVSQSKVFILGGFPVAALLLLALFMRKRPGAIFGMAGSALAGFLALSTTEWWSAVGYPYLARLAAGSDNPVWLYTAGRYGEDASAASLTSYILETAPLAGYGSRGPALGPLDTVWLEMLARGGIIALALFLSWMAVAANAWVSAGRHGDARELWWLSGALFLVTVAAAMGGPALTQNRAATLLILNLLLVIVALRQGKDVSTGPGERPLVRAGAVTRRRWR